MPDIINRAKRLFENRYHDEPWLALFDSSQERFWVETDNFAEVCGDFVSEDDTRLAAAAPEMAQALAEETWEYRVLAKGNSPGLEERIFDTLEQAQKEHGHQKALHLAGVRGRPSPIEVRRVTEWRVTE